jgi:hypothetical protein
VGGFTFRVCQRLDADEPRANTLKNIDLPANADPGQWTELVDDWCGPTTFPDEREWVVIVHISHGFWGRNIQRSIFVLSGKFHVSFLFPFLCSLFQRF